MVKSVLGSTHNGLRDWLFQRVTAIVMALYLVGMVGFFLTTAVVTFDQWHHLFSHVTMKVATILCVISILYHTWVGMWTVFTDYIYAYWLRLIAETLVVFLLLGTFFWTLLILWDIH